MVESTIAQNELTAATSPVSQTPGNSSHTRIEGMEAQLLAAVKRQDWVEAFVVAHNIRDTSHVRTQAELAQLIPNDTVVFLWYLTDEWCGVFVCTRGTVADALAVQVLVYDAVAVDQLLRA
jgi:hypothetical protein